MKKPDELRVAIEVAKKAGKLILRQNYSKKIIGFKSKVNFVTNVDKNSEKLITNLLLKEFPDYGILAEEGTKEKGENVWIIDPLDGTTNFMHGYPFFCVSIALVKNGKQFLGVVYDPNKNEIFYALNKKGAFLNENKIEASKTKYIHSSLLATGFYYDRKEIMERTVKKIGEFLSLGIQGIRRDGAAALDLCYVACGRFDGYWEYILSPWDFAAGSLIAKEAGAIVTTTEGKQIEMKKNGILAANKFLYKKMLEIVSKE
ncbi:MAG: inositol monophosphatase family protein [Candidatus Aenigmatarchaeota archaeon]